jgi:antitoxin component of MazEF toxin-antitoxin module
MFQGSEGRFNRGMSGYGLVLTSDTQRVYILFMTKKLIQHGNSAALVIDKALMDLLKVRMDTPLEVTTDGRNIIISPQTNERAEAELLVALERINQKHGSVLAKLGK